MHSAIRTADSLLMVTSGLGQICAVGEYYADLLIGQTLIGAIPGLGEYLSVRNVVADDRAIPNGCG